MNKPIGKKIWAIAEGYLPEWSNGPEPQMVSHETACILNTSDEEAHIVLLIYFSDRDPAGPYQISIPPRRMKHIRFNNLEDPEPIPKDTDYASVFSSDVPVIVQHSRLDSRQSENALLTTIAYAE
ncbi:MAG TPA: sensory rhodopsin transducer [Fodinibius sp.]|nr:sensory rhodopsin transducer [Fodinibius sp.]